MVLKAEWCFIRGSYTSKYEGNISDKTSGLKVEWYLKRGSYTSKYEGNIYEKTSGLKSRVVLEKRFM